MGARPPCKAARNEPPLKERAKVQPWPSEDSLATDKESLHKKILGPTGQDLAGGIARFPHRGDRKAKPLFRRSFQAIHHTIHIQTKALRGRAPGWLPRWRVGTPAAARQVVVRLPAPHHNQRACPLVNKGSSPRRRSIRRASYLSQDSLLTYAVGYGMMRVGP